MWVKQNSGMMNVVPSWKLLDEPEVVEMRKDREKRIYEDHGEPD